MYSAAGVNIPNVVATLESQSETGGFTSTAYMWDSELLYDGFLYSIEGIAKTPGDIRITVLCHQLVGSAARKLRIIAENFTAFLTS